MPLLKKEHVVAVFFYLEKAYDTTWKHGIMKDLHKLGLKGRLPLFIQNFLSDRTFNVRIGNTISDIFIIVQQKMVSNFQKQKLNAFIFVGYDSYI